MEHAHTTWFLVASVKSFRFIHRIHFIRTSEGSEMWQWSHLHFPRYLSFCLRPRPILRCGCFPPAPTSLYHIQSCNHGAHTCSPMLCHLQLNFHRDTNRRRRSYSTAGDDVTSNTLTLHYSTCPLLGNIKQSFI